MPTTATAQTRYWTHQASRNESNEYPPRAWITRPIASITSRAARKPPTFTAPCAVPRVAPGLNVRAMSKPTTEPGPPDEITVTSTTSSQ